ncbi:MAG: hypothetical protein SH850_18820 [Planctomycetaceae bacterium]|nr:hypothetical protein [Planctomycetaceae bacterium]
MSKLLTFLALTGVSAFGLVSGGNTATAKAAGGCCSGGSCRVCVNCACDCVAGCQCCDTGVCTCGDACDCVCCAAQSARGEQSGEAALLTASNVTFTGAAQTAGCCADKSCAACADCPTGECRCEACDCACCATR